MSRKGPQHRLNMNIKVREVFLVDEDGTKLGVMPIDKAVSLARTKGLDLVEVSGNARPPVCKILDYGRFKYEEKKRKRQTGRKAHAGQIKEIRMRPRTDVHDLDFKLNRGRGFLTDGNKLQITIVFRGREMARQDLGRDLMSSIVKRLDDIAKVERNPRQEGRRLSAVFTPRGKGDGKAKNKQVRRKAVQTKPKRESPVQAGGEAKAPVGQIPKPPPEAPKVGPAG